VRAEQAEAQVGAEHVTELRAGAVAGAQVPVADAGREIRLDADAGRGQRHGYPDGADDVGLLLALHGTRPDRAGLQVEGERQQATANKTERRIAAPSRHHKGIYDSIERGDT